jgi:hypothetical protein
MLDPLWLTTALSVAALLHQSCLMMFATTVRWSAHDWTLTGLMEELPIYEGKSWSTVLDFWTLFAPFTLGLLLMIRRLFAKAPARVRWITMIITLLMLLAKMDNHVEVALAAQ